MTQKTRLDEAGRAQCTASFQTPDGERHYCQHRGRLGHPGRHIYNVVRHPVVWTGTSSEKEATAGFCGYAKCPGARHA